MKSAPIVEQSTIETKPFVRRRSWYLDRKNIRTPSQFRWTLQERIILHDLRVKKEWSIAAIQRYLRKLNGIPMYLAADDDKDKYSRTRLHNQIRIIRGSFNGLCHRCRNPLSKKELKRINNRVKEDPSMGLCDECMGKSTEYKREKRNESLKQGICGVCNKRKITKGHTTCKKCLSATHRHRYLNKLCGKCGKNPLAKNSITLCQGCLEENRNVSREYRKRIKREAKAKNKK